MKRFLLTLGFSLGLASAAFAVNYAGISAPPVERINWTTVTGTANGAPLASVTGSSATVYSESTSARQPTFYSAGGPNNTPYINCTVAQGLSSAFPATAGPTNGSFRFFFVARIPDTQGRHYALGGDNVGLIPWDSGLPGSGFNSSPGGGAVSVDPVPVCVGRWALFDYKFDAVAGTGTMYVNGVQVGVTKTWTINAIANLVLGNNAGRYAGVGDLGPLFVYGLLSDTDAATVRAQITTDYAVAPPAVVAANNAGINYSPYNWLVDGNGAKTINAGAYFRTLINATTTCMINFRVGLAGVYTGSTAYTQFLARIDRGSWQLCAPTADGIGSTNGDLAQSFNVAIPPSSVTTATRHLLEVVVRNTTQSLDRYNTQQTALRVISLTLDNGASVSPATQRKYRLLVFGDSRLEGVRVNGYGPSGETAQNDILQGWALAAGEMLDAEVGIVGFGATGWAVGGSGNVPALTTSYNQLWSGQARSFAPVPDMVIYNDGINDYNQGSQNLIPAAVVSVVNGIGYSTPTFTGLPGTTHLVLGSFEGVVNSQLQAAVNTINNPRVSFGDTSNFAPITNLQNLVDSSDGLHFYGYANLAFVAPKVAGLALPLLGPGSSLSVAHGGFFF